MSYMENTVENMIGDEVMNKLRPELKIEQDTALDLFQRLLSPEERKIVKINKTERKQ